MKKYFPSLLILIAAGVFALGCNTVAYAQEDYGNYDNGFDNNADNGYDNSYDYNNDNYDQYGDNGSNAQITFNDFYTQLAPYGRWVSDPNYGRVWIANVSGFQPYSTNGYWTYTNYGWTWVSNYNWGWAPFHYGRWGYSNMYGWYWVPGYQWGPAWVGWSSTADMYGWAPLAPGTSIGVSFAIGSVPINFWTFMPRRYLGYHNIHNYYIPRSRYTTIIRHSNIISNYRGSGHGRYAMGPQARDVSRSTGRAVRTTRVVSTNNSRSAGLRNNELHVYRPAVRDASRNNSSGTNRGNSRTNIQRGNTPSRSNVNRTNGATRSTAPIRSNTNTQRSVPSRTQRSTTTQQRAQEQRTQQQRASQQRAQQQRAQQQRAQQESATQQRAQQQRAEQQRASQQRAQQQRAQQERASQQRAQQQRAEQQRASQQRAQQQRAQRATQRAQQQQAQRAERTQQRVERAEQRSSSSSNSSRRATRGR